jgi:hypothetical protein
MKKGGLPISGQSHLRETFRMFTKKEGAAI